jgi:hypothetical protein
MINQKTGSIGQPLELADPLHKRHRGIRRRFEVRSARPPDEFHPMDQLKMKAHDAFGMPGAADLRY